MKIFIAIALLISCLVGLLPILIAKKTSQGDELCDPEKYYAPVRECVILWDRALLYFGAYFVLSVVFFCVVGGILKVCKLI